jgi:hypothetical protein
LEYEVKKYLFLADAHIDLIDREKLTIKNYKSDEIKIEKILFMENKSLDILIFKVDTISLNLFSKVKRLEIFMDEFQKCAIFGYPRSREKTNNSLVLQASHPDKIDLDNNYFEVKTDTPIHSFEKSETDNIKGLSGSGVFIKGKSGKVYLIGIQNAYIDMTSLQSLNLRTIKDEINKVIEEELPIGEYPFFETLGIDISKVTFESLNEYFLSNRDIQRFKKQVSKNRDKELVKLEKDYKVLKDSMKKMADKYFYLGKESFEIKNFSRAYNCFSKAIELYPSYKHFFAKNEFMNKYLTKEQKDMRDELADEVNLLEDNEFLEKILEEEEKFLINNGDNLDLEKLYSRLVKLSSKGKNKIVSLWLKLSKIKFTNNKIEEAENILINLRDEVDNELEKEQVNQELLNIYLISLDNGSIPRNELLKKIIELEKELKEKQHIPITYIFEELKIENYYLNDCLVDHIYNQRNKIFSLEYENHQLQLANENYHYQINSNPSFVYELSQKSNISFLSMGLLVSIGVIIMLLEYFNFPTLDWIDNFNINDFINLFK